MNKNILFLARAYLYFFALVLFFSPGCNEEKLETQPSEIKTIAKDTVKPPPVLKILFTKEPIKSVNILSELTDKFGDAGMRQILAINRLDTRHIVIGDSICVPDTLPDDFLFFSPFTKQLTILDSVPKILIFAYPVQAFAAYENGVLVRWGPTSMGKRTTPTPVGLYFTNWKAKRNYQYS